jgi:uncharacterized protein (TIGR02647 family)
MAGHKFLPQPQATSGSIDWRQISRGFTTLPGLAAAVPFNRRTPLPLSPAGRSSLQQEAGVPMAFTPELVAELEILALFNLSNTQEGIKVHHTAAPTAIAAAKRLHDKGLISQADGGYLTSLGLDAVEHTQVLLSILTVPEVA